MTRSSSWKWWITGLLLLATTINYMDRQTLSNAADAVKLEFGLKDTQYGHLGTAFGLAFAAGSLVFGFLSERWSLRWLYPLVLGGWSLAGLFSSWATDYHEFMAARVMLGFFEAGHWPCALKTTFRLLRPDERMMGNSVLQSGASIGAIITPHVVLYLSQNHPDGWRYAFQVVAWSGVVWIALWLLSYRQSPVAVATSEPQYADSLLPMIRSRRFWAVAILLIGIQIPWHMILQWLKLFLISRGYDQSQAATFISAYYIATDLGCIAAGVISMKMAGVGVHQVKRRIFTVAACFVSFTIFIPLLGKGWPLLAVLLIVGAASLALFPCYYSFVQELSDTHVARLTGLFSMWVWVITSPMHSLFGIIADATGTYDWGLALAGLAPWLGVAAMKWLWVKRTEESASPAA